VEGGDRRIVAPVNVLVWRRRRQATRNVVRAIWRKLLAASAIISAAGGLDVTVDLKALARLGARARIAELIAEIDALLDAFPEIGDAPARPGRGQPVGRRRKRSRMSPAARRAASQRMKKYWAQKRKAKKGR
jgi:hypothetical protein